MGIIGRRSYSELYQGSDDTNDMIENYDDCIINEDRDYSGENLMDEQMLEDKEDTAISSPASSSLFVFVFVFVFGDGSFSSWLLLLSFPLFVSSFFFSSWPGGKSSTKTTSPSRARFRSSGPSRTTSLAWDPRSHVQNAAPSRTGKHRIVPRTMVGSLALYRVRHSSVVKYRG